MEKFIAVYSKFLNAITKLTGCIAGFLVLMCGFMIVYEVICRGMFNAPTDWVMEISTYCVIIAGFFGMGITYAGKKHIHVDILLSRLSPKTCCYIEVLTSLAGIFYSFVFTVEAWDMVMMSKELNTLAPTVLSTPLWIPQMSMPIGMAVLTLQLIRTFLVDLAKIKNQNFSEEESR